MFRVVFFSTEGGRQSVVEWLRTFEKEDRIVIGADLRTVQFGFPIGMPVCRPLGDSLYEVRSSLPSKREARLIFFQDGTDLVVVGGFIKKTRVTPSAELLAAKRRKNAYLSKSQARKGKS